MHLNCTENIGEPLERLSITIGPNKVQLFNLEQAAGARAGAVGALATSIILQSVQHVPENRY